MDCTFPLDALLSSPRTRLNRLRRFSNGLHACTTLSTYYTFSSCLFPFEEYQGHQESPVVITSTATSHSFSLLHRGRAPTASMASSAGDLLDLMLNSTWQCLEDTPFNQKHIAFAQLLPTLASLTDATTHSSLAFCPGLLNVLQSDSPPSTEYFKTLPTEVKSRWGIYALVFEKPGHRSRLYIGSGTSTMYGVESRFKHYDVGTHTMPTHVRQAFDEGWSMVSKGLLCWCPIPGSARVPTARLLFIALEATFAYIFWAMRTLKGTYGMAHLCPWGNTALEYDGMCSHCSLNEGIRAHWDMTPDQLEQAAADAEKKRRELKALNHTNHHHKQMAENYDEYIGKAGERVARSRANNPGWYLVGQARRAKEAREEKRYHCQICDLSFSTQHILNDHLKSAKHKRKEAERHNPNPYKCGPCNLGFHNPGNLRRHRKSERHAKAVALLKSSSKLD